MRRSNERVIFVVLVALSILGLALFLYYMLSVLSALPEPVPDEAAVAGLLRLLPL